MCTRSPLPSRRHVDGNMDLPIEHERNCDNADVKLHRAFDVRSEKLPMRRRESIPARAPIHFIHESIHPTTVLVPDNTFPARPPGTVPFF